MCFNLINPFESLWSVIMGKAITVVEGSVLTATKPLGFSAVSRISIFSYVIRLNTKILFSQTTIILSFFIFTFFIDEVNLSSLMTFAW